MEPSYPRPLFESRDSALYFRGLELGFGSVHAHLACARRCGTEHELSAENESCNRLRYRSVVREDYFVLRLLDSII